MVGIERAPVFLVGAPRSGTTMLTAMFAAHPAFAAGPETQFFSKLPYAELERAAASDRWPDEAVELLGRLTSADQPVIDLFENDVPGVRAYLEGREPSIAAMLESLTEPFAKRRGKARWVEKTPNHITHGPVLRRNWPKARIIRIVRDPRDVGVSTRKLPAFSDRILPNVYLWLRWHRAAHDFFAQDPGSITVRYEDVVDDPEAELARLCAFVGEDYDAGMLGFAKVAGDVAAEGESWKGQVGERLSSSRKYAWRRTLPDALRPLCDAACAELLDHFGYEREYEARETRTAYRMSRAYIERQEDALIRDAARGIRWLPVDETRSADRIVDHPLYSRFRDPVMLARLGAGRLASAADRWRARAS